RTPDKRLEYTADVLAGTFAHKRSPTARISTISKMPENGKSKLRRSSPVVLGTEYNGISLSALADTCTWKAAIGPVARACDTDFTTIVDSFAINFWKVVGGGGAGRTIN